MLRRFKELQAATAEYIGEKLPSRNLASFMAAGYTAYACMAVRRLSDLPRELRELRRKKKAKTIQPQPLPKTRATSWEDVISLSALLWEIQKAVRVKLTLVSLNKQRTRYRKSLRKDIADGAAGRAHYALAGDNKQFLTERRVAADIRMIEGIAARVGKMASRTIAHLPMDSRRIPRGLPFAVTEKAILGLEEIFLRYSLGILGRSVHVPFDQFSIRDDLMKVWDRMPTPIEDNIGEIP